MTKRTKKPKGEVPKTTRTRTADQEVILKSVRQYQALMKVRIGVSNGLSAMMRQELFTPDEIKSMTTEMVKPWEKMEGEVIKAAAKAVKLMPIYQEWIQHVRGVGDVLAAQFVALLQPIGDFPTVGHLWSYCGLAVKDGHCVRRQAGVKSNWNPELKKLAYQLGECFVKCGGPYRELYDRYKARDKAVHPEPVKSDRKTRDGQGFMDYTDGHLHARAKRYAAKIWLSHLWQAWRELEGLECRGPYAVEYLGHTTVMSPWAFIHKKRMAG